MSAVQRGAPGVAGIAMLAVSATLPVSILSSVGIGFGLPVGVLLPTAIAVSVWGAVSATARRPAGLGQLTSRTVGCVAIGIAVRLTAGAMDGTLAQLTGLNLVFDGRVAAAVFVAAIVFALAHALAQRAVRLTDAATLIEEGVATRSLLGMMLGIVLGVLVVQSLPAVRTGLVADVVMVLALVATFVALADLRARLRAPGGTRAAVIERPRSTVNRAMLLGIALVALVALALVPLANAMTVPDAGPAIQWLGAQDWFDIGSGGDRQPPEGQRFGRPQEREVVPRPAVGERWSPSFDGEVPVWLGLLVAGGVIAAVLRPDRLLALWRGLRARLAVGRGDDDGEVALERAAPRTDGEQSRASGRAGLLGRFRPRPREPRSAILHDYGRLERILARRGYGRAVGETPIGHARRLRASEDLEAFVALVSEARWSDHTVSAEQAAAARRRLAAILGRLDALGPESDHTVSGV